MTEAMSFPLPHDSGNSPLVARHVSSLDVGHPLSPKTGATIQQRHPQVVGARKRESTPAPRVVPPAVSTSPAQPDSRGIQVPVLRQPVPPSKSPAGASKAAAAFAEGTLRAGFRKKVYGILTAQMVMTVGVSLVCMRVAPIRNTLVTLASSGSSTLKIAMFVPTLLSLLILQLGAKSHYPSNYLFLFMFTLGKSVNVGFVCAMYDAAGLGETVALAFAITAAVFFILTAYALISGKDFSYLRGFLITMLVGLVSAVLAGLLFPSLGCSLAVSILGALIFCAYILYDTWRIEKQFSYDDYISATIELYLDIINLFMYVLKILVELTAKKKND